MPLTPGSARRGRRQGQAERIDGRDVAITHPDKVLWPADRITKGDLIAYYRAIAPRVLPHLAGRPLVMRPFPNGITTAGYYRQSLPATAPAWLPRYQHVARADGRANAMPVADGASVLVWLANQGAIELHPWLSRTDAPDLPDYVVFDLDVVEAELFPHAIEVALLVRDALEQRGLRGYPKTTGGDGLHIYVPVTRRPTYEVTRGWARRLAEEIARRHPALVATDAGIAGREEKVLIDYAQNSLGRTTAAAYSVRPRPGATVSAPVTWREVEDKQVRPAEFTIRTMPARVAALGDLFRPVLEGGQALDSKNSGAGGV